MFLRLLRAAECNDFRRLAGRHRKPRSRRYGETRGIVIGLYVDSIDLHFRLDIAFKEKKGRQDASQPRSEEHTSELQSLMRISYAVFCLKKKTQTQRPHKKKQKAQATIYRGNNK